MGFFVTWRERTLGKRDAVLQVVRVKMKHGAFKEALEILQKDIDGDAALNAEVLAYKTTCSLRVGDGIEATLYLKTAMELDPNNAQVILAKARVYSFDKRYDEALEYAQKANTMLHTQESALALANCLAAKERFSDAIVLMEEVCRKDRYYVDGFALLGKLYRSIGDGQRSLEAAERAVQLRPDLHQTWSFIAEHYSKNSDLKKCIACLEMAVKYGGDVNPAYNILLGEYLRISGDLSRSLRILRDVVDNKPMAEPQVVAALVNLGATLQEGQRDDEAVEYYKKALRIDPNLPQVENNLAKYYLRDEKFEEAEYHLSNAIAANPKYHKAMHNLASIMSFQGRREEAFAQHRNSIKYAIESYPEDFIEPQKDPMAVDAADVCLVDVHDILEKIGVPFFLAFGTLLGLHRDGKLLPYDKDLDIGVPWDVPRKSLLLKLKAFGYTYHSEDKITDDKPVYNYGLYHKRTGVSIDFFFFKREGDTYITGIDSKPIELTWTFPYFQLQEATWKDRKWLVPSPPELFFESVYGKEWRTPDPYFNTVISGLNRNKESDPIALNSAYSGIYDNMTRCAWTKAIGCCKQLQKIRHDPFIETVEHWLEDKKEHA